MSKIVKDSLPKQIASTIELQIKNGEYKVGDKLPTEPELVKIFGVSRNTLREAIQSLTHSGILETRQGDGTYVVAVERFQVDFFNIMNSTTAQEVLEVRNLFEQYIVMSAIKNATKKDIEEIEKYLQLRKKEAKTIRENTKADLDFHIAIAKATHNEIILNIYNYVSKYFSEYIYNKIYDKKSDQKYIDELHDLLFKAIKEKDTKLAQDSINKIIEM